MVSNLSEKLKEPNFSYPFSTHKLAVMSVHTSKAMGLQGVKRRVVFVGLYELIAIVCASLLFMAIGQDAGSSGGMAVAASTIAIIWNLTFNWLFEQWELRQTQKGRSLLRRIAHAVGFEGGIAAMLIPLMAWWFNISLWEATVMEAGLLVFFMVYTFVFNWSFDRIFGLPASAQLLQVDAVPSI